MYDAMELAVNRLAIICFLVIGVSHIVQPKTWARFFVALHGQGKIGSFLNALLHFPLGLVIVSFHNVWSGKPLILTLIGWALIVKSLVYFLFPGFGLRALGRISVERAWEFVVAGCFSLGIGGLLGYILLTRS